MRPSCPAPPHPPQHADKLVEAYTEVDQAYQTAADAVTEQLSALQSHTGTSRVGACCAAGRSAGAIRVRACCAGGRSAGASRVGAGCADPATALVHTGQLHHQDLGWVHDEPELCHLQHGRRMRHCLNNTVNIAAGLLFLLC